MDSCDSSNTNITKQDDKFSPNDILNIDNSKVPLKSYKKGLDINPLLFLSKNFLLNGCNIPEKYLDSIGDCLGGWRENGQNGPLNYLKGFTPPPKDWVAVGLKVINLYDFGNNSWIGTQHLEGEWYIAYHGTPLIDSIEKIVVNGFRRGPRQLCKDFPNINPLNNKYYPTCGEGVYLTPNFNVALRYAKIISFSGNKFSVIFMCRININEVKIANTTEGEYYIVNGDKLNDPNGMKKDNEIRPYRILVKIEKENFDNIKNAN